MKSCRKCGQSKSVDLFGKNKRYADGCWPYCRECDRERAADYRKKNPDKVREISAKSRAKNPDRVAETKRKYRERNAEKIRLSRKAAYEKNKCAELARALEYKEKNKLELARKAATRLRNNPYLNRFYRSERRAAEKQARPAWYSRDKARSLYRLASYLAELTGISFHVDHIVPLKSDLVCGLHWHGNMQVITGSENQSKSNRHWPDMPTETHHG